MATFTNGMSNTEIERAKNQKDKKYISSEYVECPNCGHDEKIITYYDTLLNDSTCVNCLHTY